MADVKSFSYILQFLYDFLNNGYKKSSFKLLPEKFFFIDDLITLPEMHEFTVADIHNAVQSDVQLRFHIVGNRIQVKSSKLNNEMNVNLSKKLSHILRHSAETEGLSFEFGGWLYVEDVLSLRQFSRYSLADVRHVVATNDKQRFEMQAHSSSGRMMIRASQGHSLKVEGMEYLEITQANAINYPVVVHGTYFKNWPSIRETGLSRCSRVHIHFAIGEANDSHVISGMRASSEIVIYLNLELALQDGLKFFVSRNNVILSEGDSRGFIATKYFKSAFQCRPRQELFFDRGAS